MSALPDIVALPDPLTQMVADRQISETEARSFLAEVDASGQLELTEAAALRWLAHAYELNYTELDDVTPDRELLALFPARILLREALLPLRRNDAGIIEVATSRLLATGGHDGPTAGTRDPLGQAVDGRSALAPPRRHRQHDRAVWLPEEEGLVVPLDLALPADRQCADALRVLSPASCFTSHGSDAMVSEITRTATNTADKRIALSSVIAIPVFEAAP